MNFLEKDLESIIYENSLTKEGREILRERGLDLNGFTFRQVDFGSFGRADLVNVFIDKMGGDIYRVDANIIELKKDEINIDALLQAYRYAHAFEHHLKQTDATKRYYLETYITLIGNTIDTKSDFVFLYNQLSNVSIYTYEYKIDGIWFEYQSQNWTQNNAILARDTISLMDNPKVSLLRKIMQNE